MRKNLTGLLVLAIMVLTTSAWTSVYGPVSAAARHASGIEILGPAAAVSPVEQQLLQAWSDALLIAEAYDGLGYPWADTATGTLVLSTTSPAGEALANQWITSGLTHRNPKVGNLAKPAVPVRLRAVSLSYRQLEAIKFEATQLVAAGVPDADAIYEAAPGLEAESNRAHDQPTE
jgi:hypothetical protein